MTHLLQIGLFVPLLFGSQVAAIALKGTAGKNAKSAEDVIKEFGGSKELCDYWGYQPLPADAPRPRIFYGTLAGNEGQDDVYETHFLEISPFVSRIVAVDPRMTFLGFARNQSINMSRPAFERFGEQLVHIVLEHPFPGTSLKQRAGYQEMSPEQKNFFLRPGKTPRGGLFQIEQWSRAQIERGFKDSEGRWLPNDDDIVIYADSDEIPMPSILVAMQHCEVPVFAEAKRKMAAGENATEVCERAKLALKSQVYEYFLDCPVKQPVWWHPDAIPATCVLNGAFDLEDVRIRGTSKMTKNIAARHLHNLGMSPEDIIFKYASYAEPRAPGHDSGLDVETNQEMMWRVCDPRAPELGPGDWHMRVRPSNALIRTGEKQNARGYSQPAEMRRGIDETFAILKERPELAEKFMWSGHGEKRNPFVGKQGGENSFNY